MKRSVAAVLLMLAAIVGGCATATVLPDGRILFLDGISKIYDPAVGRLANALPASARPKPPFRDPAAGRQGAPGRRPGG